MKLSALILLVILACSTVSQSQETLLQPHHFQYLGAFRLPDGSNGTDWGYSGHAMTYFPLGDHSGLIDGFPGSLYGVGHAWQMYVSEFNIPVPVISSTKSFDDLNTASTFRTFTDVRAGVGNLSVLQEIPRVGMEFLPAQGEQSSPKLYLAWGAHFQEDDQNVASHMWCETDFSNPAGAWWAGDSSLYSVNDYLFEIPSAWADANVSGNYLATGRFRDGGWSGMGPCLYAIAPWKHGNPPANNTRLDAIMMMQYSRTIWEDQTDNKMTNYHNSDEWTGGAWITSNDLSAVVFAGTKGIGDSAWYGNSLGPCLTCDERGWWSDAFQGQIIFYDPNDFAQVAAGTMRPYEPQPYAVLDIDDVMYSVDSANMKHHTGACAFDRSNGLFYMFEPTADEDKSIVHVWQIDPSATGSVDPDPASDFLLGSNYPNPYSVSTTIPFSVAKATRVSITVHDMLGRKIATIVQGELFTAGQYTKSFYANKIPPGVYMIRMQAGDQLAVRQMAVLK